MDNWYLKMYSCTAPNIQVVFEVMGIEQVKAKFDIQSTQQVIDMLGLMGDASDNIPGCPGVGEKTAQKLISEFGSIENLLEHTDQLKRCL